MQHLHPSCWRTCLPKDAHAALLSQRNQRLHTPSPKKARGSTFQSIACSCLSPFGRSYDLAQARLHESARPDALLRDPYAAALCAQQQQNSTDTATSSSTPSSSPSHQQQQSTQDIISTKYIDDTLDVAMASTSMNTINRGDYQQVVLLGDALDTRPFRTLWPKGTMFFLVAPAEAHRVADKVLKEQGARVPSGCLLRRVPADLSKAQEDGEPVFLPQLERAGYQGSNLSVWAIQGLDGFNLNTPRVHALFCEVASAAAYHSLLVGELPAMQHKEAEHILAEVGFLSTVLPFGTDATSYGRWSHASRQEYDEACSSQAPDSIRSEHESQCLTAGSEQSHFDGEARSQSGSPASSSDLNSTIGNDAARKWLFTSQQMRLSFAQMDVYTTHLAAAEEVDEDFTGNFS
ncbi:leucine carboxyl methyltransferase-domain-containing protein [Dunaliella salina]|uniref:Leucine carboxyl methyltransferase-domain-containing protein n=1 Tax=Dunaliella salina TaxID=3046 RepID=A0ABQ7GWR9_DUNSA|nr:leucine carboxyl methyltransferase-domain-containing protein [Dunaliella salina]|eukprot:KAF5839045.1 leucine carboxyl methyltransferase-domain-containing protein [Dunaliella salina]